MFSLIVPIFNEKEVVEHTIRTLHETLSKNGGGFEIIAVDDGSTDGAAQILSALQLPHVHVLIHPQNRGYSSSIKAGMRHAKGDIFGIVDADGTYPLEKFPEFLKTMRETDADMVVGARAKGKNIPFLRRPAKAIVNALANNLTGMKIPDLNSGMRIFTRELGMRFMHLYPQRFSFTITITLAALTNDYLVQYLPIEYGKRQGKSTLSSGFNGLKNFGNFLSLIIRIVTYFRPLRFFLWPSAILMAGGVGVVGYTLWQDANVSDSGMLLIMTGLQVGLFGLLAETVVRHRSA